jgi:hypothetical protein
VREKNIFLMISIFRDEELSEENSQKMPLSEKCRKNAD